MKGIRRLTAPQELLAALSEIFPSYQQYYKEDDDSPKSFHSILIEFTGFFGACKAEFSESQLRSFGCLVNEAVAHDDELENAFATCFLEHLGQIKGNRDLNPLN